MALPDKKEERQKRKDAKLGTQIASETKDAGIDLKKPAKIGPLGSEQKAEIDKRLSDYAQEDMREGLKKFQNLYKAPDVSIPKAPSEDQLKRSLRKERRARFGDILTGLGRGFRGASVDPSKFRGSQIRQEREDQYKQFKDASQATKKRLEEWGSGYAQKQIDYLEGLKKDEMSPLKIQKIEAEIDATKALAESRRRKPVSTRSTKAKPLYTHQTEEGNWKITNQKNPYSDLYYKLTGNSQSIINELGKLAGSPIDSKTGELKSALKDSEVERLSNTLLSKAFDIQVDEKGNRLAIPMPGKENFMQDLSSFIDSTNKIKAEKKRLQSEMDQEIYDAESEGWFGKSKEDVQEAIRVKYEGLMDDADANLQESQNTLKAMLSGEYTPSEKTSTKQTETEEVDPWEL